MGYGKLPKNCSSKTDGETPSSHREEAMVKRLMLTFEGTATWQAPLKGVTG